MSKAHVVRITLYFPTYLETLDLDIIQYYHTILTNQEQYGLIHNYAFTKIRPILSSLDQDTIRLKA